MKKFSKKSGGVRTRSTKKTVKDSFSTPLKNYNNFDEVKNTFDVLIRPTLFDDIIDEKFLSYSNSLTIKNKIDYVLDSFKNFSFSITLYPLDLMTGDFKTEENSINLLNHYSLVSDSNKSMNSNINNKLSMEQIPLTMCKFEVKIHYNSNSNSNSSKDEVLIINCFEESKKYVNNSESKMRYDNIYKIFISALALNNNLITEPLEKIAIFINTLSLLSEKSIPKIRFDLGGSLKKNVEKKIYDLSNLLTKTNFNTEKGQSSIPLQNNTNINLNENNPYLIYRDYILTKIFKNIQIRKNAENAKSKLIETIKQQELEEFKEIKESIKANTILNIEPPYPFEYDIDGNVIMRNLNGSPVYPQYIPQKPSNSSLNENTEMTGGLKKSRKPRKKV